MLTVYLSCAVIGGVILVVQFVLTLTGIVGDADDLDTGEVDDGQGSSMFFQVLSFRSLVAALTFFGLGGGLARSAGLPDLMGFAFAAMLGVLAMIGVAWIMKLLLQLREEGNVHVEYALGAGAVVYLPIPGQHQGQGKITVVVQNRSMEYNAVTAGDALPAGKTVAVTGIIDENTVEVAEQE